MDKLIEFYEPINIAAHYPAGFDWETVSKDGQIRKPMTPIDKDVELYIV